MSATFEAVTNKFPFAAILIGDLLQGALFTVVNGPILFIIFRTGIVPRSLMDGYKSAASQGFVAITNSGSQLLMLIVLGALCFAIPQILNPMAKTIGILVGKLLSIRGEKGYTSYDISAPTYPRFVARLIRDPFAKSHWEWELFMFYQRRAATVTFSIWIILLIWIRYVHWGPNFEPAYAVELVIASFIFVGTVWTMVESSRIMRRTHDLYADLPELQYSTTGQEGERNFDTHEPLPPQQSSKATAPGQ